MVRESHLESPKLNLVFASLRGYFHDLVHVGEICATNETTSPVLLQVMVPVKLVALKHKDSRHKLSFFEALDFMKAGRQAFQELFYIYWSINAIALKMLLNSHNCKCIASLEYETIFVWAILGEEHVPQQLLRSVELRLFVHFVRILLDECLNSLVQVTLYGFIA